jgi:hypothetical protein
MTTNQTLSRQPLEKSKKCSFTLIYNPQISRKVVTGGTIYEEIVRLLVSCFKVQILMFVISKPLKWVQLKKIFFSSIAIKAAIWV